MRDLSRVLTELQKQRVEALADVRRLEGAIVALGAPVRPHRGRAASTRRRRGRRTFTAAQKKAASDRMKKFWAEKRKQAKHG